MIKIIQTQEYPTQRCWMILIVGLICLSSSNVYAQSITFTKIVDTNTLMPGGKGNFSRVDIPVIDENDIVFRGWDFELIWGIYTFIDGKLDLVANKNTMIPDDNDTFRIVSDPVIDNKTIAFFGQNHSFQGGLYWNIGGLNVVVNHNTTIPGGEGNFTNFNLYSLSNNEIAFRGWGKSLAKGIYLYSNGVVSVIADQNTIVPGRTDTFVDFPEDIISIDKGNITFIGEFSKSSQKAVYLFSDGITHLIADENTPIPGDKGNFTGFLAPTTRDGKVVFRGAGMNLEGIYTYTDSVLDVVADQNTLAPDGIGNFTTFFAPSIDKNNIAFGAIYEENFFEFIGLYLRWKGNLIKVIDTTDFIEGNAVIALGSTLQPLSGNQLVFAALFPDGSTAIYKATIDDCNNNGLDDDCDIDCGELAGVCDQPGCGESADANSNGIPDECDPQIPTLSQWSLAVFALLILSAGSIMIRTKQMAA